MTGYKSKKAAAQDKLAQPAQEPVAWAVVGDGKFGEYELGQVFVDYASTHTYWENRGYELVPVYTTLPQRPWVGLTDEDVTRESAMIALKMKLAFHAGMYVAQKILKERNNG